MLVPGVEPATNVSDLRRRTAVAGRRGLRMKAKLIFQYDRDADILYISKRHPYPEQESEEVSDGVVARLNPATW